MATGITESICLINNELQHQILQFVYDPYGYVLFNWDWNHGELEGETGPDKWQTEILKLVGEKTRDGDLEGALQIAVRSGHGIGKSTLMSWIIKWFMDCRPHPQIVVTANTATQLETKTWRELAKWHKLSMTREWCTHTATKFYRNDHAETWFAAAIPWSKTRAQAFAGTHERHVLMLFDEASEIEDLIWETAEGAMTTEGAIWIVFGNPTRNTGRFSDCFGKFKHRWITREIDSRNSKKADKAQINKWIEDYGEDSDFVRIRVKGQEPRTGSLQYFSTEMVREALGRKIGKSVYEHQAKILAVDPARYGDDCTAIIKRQGLAAYDLEKKRELDTITVGMLVNQIAEDWSADAIIVDTVGIGAGVFDYLTRIAGRTDVISFMGSHKASDDKSYHNKRTECYGKLRDWLATGGAIPNDSDLRDDLEAIQYSFDNKERIILESKEDLKGRGRPSPDCADALSMTFAAIIQPKGRGTNRAARSEDWDPYGRD